jgi:aspartate/methionine/tyrosine aminotransferase
MAVVKPGDEVIVPRPSWLSFEPVSYAIGAKIKILPLKEELGWKWDMDELNEAVTYDTKMIFMCNPNNPSGRIYNEREIKEICEIAKDNKAYVLSDEEFRGLELDAPHMSTPAACNLYYNAASISGVSKLFCAAGVRIGWVASQNKDLLAKAKIVRGLTGGLGGFQVALAWAMNDAETIRGIAEKHIEFGRSSRAVLKDFIEAQDFFTCVMPQAGFLSFPGWTYDIDTISYVDGLYDSKNVRVWDSLDYHVEKHIRLGFGRISTEEFRSTLRRIGEYNEQFE